MSRQPTYQWYQNGAVVTASIQLRPSEERGEVTADFKEEYCVIYDRGEVYWECYLANRVIPDRCKLIVKKVRGDMKLLKAEDINWSEFEADLPPAKKMALETEGTEIALEQLDLIAEEVQVMKDGLEAVAIDNQISDDSRRDVAEVGAGQRPGGGDGLGVEISFEDEQGPDGLGGRSETTLTALESVDSEMQVEGGCCSLEVDHLSHDFYDLGNRIKVKVDVSNIAETSCEVTFEERLLAIAFQTSNERFLAMFPGHTPNTTFIWKTELFASIAPESSSYQVLPRCLEVFLTKTSGSPWKTLSPSLHLPPQGGDPGKNLSGEEAKKLKQELLDSISNDRILNPPLTQVPKPVAITNNTLIESLSSGNVVTVDDRSHHTPSPSPRSLTSSSASTKSNSHLATPTSNVTTPPHGTSPKRDDSASSGKTSGYSSDSDSAKATTSTASSQQKSKSKASRSGSKSSELRRKGLSFVGLMNIGNSCFMNSIIQCLSNTAILRDYFLSNGYVSDINKKNPLGFKGDLAQSFAGIIRKLWTPDQTSFSPRQLKNVIAGKSKHFGGYQQQDSHEFMSYLLDGLHEDLNRVQEKPSTSRVETDGNDDLSDTQLADMAWQVYLQRNDSYFVDHFQGQFKSTLVCPVCQKVSVTFDPFMSLSVPIPRDMRRLPIYYVPCDPDKTPRKYVLELHPDSNLELLKASVARKTCISMPQLRVFEAYSGKFQALLSNNQHSIRDIKENDVIIVSEVLARPTGGPRKVVEINVIQRAVIPPFPKRCALCHDMSKTGMLRCSKCKAVGYCDADCQSKDWNGHKLTCRDGRPVPIGLPFVVSIPHSKFTYRHLAGMAEKFARRSVNVEFSDNAASSGESEEGVASGSSPMYSFVPVDRFGDNKEEAQPLEDRGNELVKFSGEYLAMDWQNDLKKDHYVKITQKDVLEHDVAEAAESFFQISSSNNVDLSQCIKLLTEPEMLSKEEAWFCSKCKAHQEATKQISIWRLPRILIIHLKRFSYTGQYSKDKISIKVDFPLEGLDMTSFMPVEAVAHWSEGEKPIYDLYATVNHFGAVYIGHYMAQVRGASNNKKEWLLYDDERVATNSEKMVVDKNAYILFYHLRNKPVANL